jgi:succinate dehydrogenase / fumarate reductase cytochrome b subunit
MSPLPSHFRSAIWQKAAMAVTGIFWMAFVVAHMIGNLLVFAGAETYNRYAHLLITSPLLPAAELSLLLFILLHVYSGLMLWIENRRAKPKRYAVAPRGAKAVPMVSRTMIFTGAVMVAFLVIHITTFKYGTTSLVTYDGLIVRDLYALVASAFRQPLYMAWYLVALALVGLHLFHAFASVFQTLGFYHPRYTPVIKGIGVAYAVTVALGFMALPIYFKFLI